MKKILFTIGAFALLTAGVQAQTTLTAWTFDNLAIASNATPQPSTGFGAASALGLGNSFNGTNSISNPDVLSLPGSSTDPVGPNSWRVRGSGAAPNGGNGWSTNAPIGTQGAKFSASTVGFYRIQVSFDVNATPDAEANLMVQYTTEGSIWHNATITSVGTLGVITNNTATNGTVMGSYVILTNNGATGWNNQIVVDLSGVSGVDNNPNFAVRMVNASTGSNCVDTTGALYNSTSGNWSFDNVVVQGVSFDVVTEWTFESEGTAGYVPSPAPEFGLGTALSIGFDNSYHYSDGSVGSTNAPDTLQNGIPFSSSGSSGQNVWRVRGAGGPDKGHNGWNTAAPIGTQGAEFDVSTVNYSDVMVSFDMFSTSQGEAKMCVEYTTDGWATTHNAGNLYYAANPTFIVTNSPSDPTYSPDTVTGTYFYQNIGQNFYNNFIVDFTGVPDVANNPQFAFRVVNAAQGNDCVAFNGGSYNNSSGNWRYDNVSVVGTFNGSPAPTLNYDPNATVDGPFTNTFTDVAGWRANISSVFVNGTLLTNTAYDASNPGEIIFTPSKSSLLQLSGLKNIIIFATNYSNAKVSQPVAAGVATKLAITAQPAGPSASGGTLIANPSLAITDQYGNGTATAPNTNVTVTAAVGGAGGWTLGGATNQPATNGFMTFTNLSATVNGSTAVNGAVITYTVNGYGGVGQVTVTNSSSFNIGAPPAKFTRGNLAALQIDTVANNTTFSMVEVKPSASKQTVPVNIVPISATGTNALRMTSAGSAGKLALSDDGTLLCFAGFADGSSASPDETFVLSRAVGTLDYTNGFTSPMNYTSISLGGSQARAACTLDNLNWIVDDKGGLYYGHGTVQNPNINVLNNVVVRTFGGVPYVETQKTASGSPIPVVYSLAFDSATGVYDDAVPNNLATDPVASDFYMISTNGGSTYDILYIVEGVSSSQGIIRKFSWVPDMSQISGYSWATNGAFTNSTGADGLFATTNGSGSVYLYYTTGGGGTAGNSIVRITDASAWNQPMNVTSSNVIYTASGTTSIKGLVFVPQQTANTAELIPPPVLLPQTGAKVSSTFNVTNSPDDPAWRSAITGITVNGTTLAPAAYTTTVAGKLVFDPSQSVLLQTTGNKTIVISATGYSTNSVVQALVSGTASQLVITTQPTAPAADGGLLGHQPVVVVKDSFGNTVTNNVNITAAAALPLPINWTLGGTKILGTSAGTATYAGLTAFGTNSVSGAAISFTSGGLSVTSSPAFGIPAPIQSTLGGAAFNGSTFAFAFTNATGLSFSVVATNNLTAPVATWPVVGSAVESPAGSGNYVYTNSAPTNTAQYFLLRQP
jgi:hypothetical protein